MLRATDPRFVNSCVIFACVNTVLTSPLCTYHLLPRGSTPGTPPGNPGAMEQFSHLFFPRGRGELFSFGNDFAGPRDKDLFEFWSAVYRSRPKFFRAILFHFDAKFRYYVVGVPYSP